MSFCHFYWLFVIIWLIYGIVMDSIAKARSFARHWLGMCPCVCVCVYCESFIIFLELYFEMCNSVTTVSIRFIRYKYENQHKMTPFTTASFFFFSSLRLFVFQHCCYSISHSILKGFTALAKLKSKWNRCNAVSMCGCYGHIVLIMIFVWSIGSTVHWVGWLQLTLVKWKCSAFHLKWLLIPCNRTISNKH